MSEFSVITIIISDGRVYKVKVIILPFDCKIQRVVKALKIFEMCGRYIFLNKTISIYKAANIKVKTRYITSRQLINFPIL